MTRLDWMTNAPCLDVDPEIMFPEGDQNVRTATDVCAECDSRLACLQYALEQDLQYGVFGGTTASQRATIKRRQRRERLQERVHAA